MALAVENTHSSHQACSDTLLLKARSRHRMAVVILASCIAGLVFFGPASLAKLIKRKHFGRKPAVATRKQASKERARPKRREEAEPERERYEQLLEQEEYWATRVTYPTGKFDPAWLREAKKEDLLIERALPAGRANP